MIINSEPVYNDGNAYRVNDFGHALILSDDHIHNNRLKPDVIALIKDQQLQGVEINYTFNFTKNDLLFLEDIKWIKSILVIKQELDLKGLYTLRNLEELNVSANNVEALDLESFPHLTKLTMRWTSGRKSILGLSNLRYLFLDSFDKEDLSELKNLQKLAQLLLINSSIKRLTGINQLPVLSDLTIAYNKKLGTIEDLAGARALKSITLKNLSQLVSLKPLTDCETIELVDVENCKKIEDSSSLFQLKDLRVISYINSGSFRTIQGIERYQSLESFYFGNTNVEDGDLSPLLKLKNLKRVFFADKNKYSHALKEIRAAHRIP
jgi:Leucine-rich repeat (LRR) protein